MTNKEKGDEMIRMMMLRPEKMMALICDEAEVLHRSATDMQESGITCFLERFLTSRTDENALQIKTTPTKG